MAAEPLPNLWLRNTSAKTVGQEQAQREGVGTNTVIWADLEKNTQGGW
jgi:hypothetical protein